MFLERFVCVRASLDVCTVGALSDRLASNRPLELRA
jgi:hypothetical protein